MLLDWKDVFQKFSIIGYHVFTNFPKMYETNISNIELETLKLKTFSEAKNVTHLIAPHNRISEIPANIFFNVNKLVRVDFSDNKIIRVDRINKIIISSQSNGKVSSVALKLEYCLSN